MPKYEEKERCRRKFFKYNYFLKKHQNRFCAYTYIYCAYTCAYTLDFVLTPCAYTYTLDLDFVLTLLYKLEMIKGYTSLLQKFYHPHLYEISRRAHQKCFPEGQRRENIHRLTIAHFDWTLKYLSSHKLRKI